MTDSTSRGPQGAHPPETHPPEIRVAETHPAEGAGQPVHLVRGNASPEELSALIAVVVVLSSVEGDHDRGQADRPASERRENRRPEWNSPARMVRTTPHHGPGGWRASASPR